MFDLVVRSDYYGDGCGYEHSYESYSSDYEYSAVTHGHRLVALTMQRGVVSYETTPQEPQVLGDTDEVEPVNEPEEVSTHYMPETFVLAGMGCTKGYCPGMDDLVASNDQDSAEDNDSKIVDSDGDGVPDSEDPEPNNPDVTGLEDTASDDSEDNDTPLYWWVVGAGSVAVLWYVLWRRSDG